MAIQQTPELERALQLGADRNASDVFLLPNEPIALRINGSLVRTDGPPLTPDDVRQAAVAAVGEERLSEVGSQRGRMVVSCGLPGAANGRMTIARSLGELTIVVRMLRYRIPTVAEVRIPAAVIEAAGSPNGLVLFSGLAGSGKTTSMLAMVEDINQREPVHICTVEDPIAFIFTPKRALVQQREVGVDCPDTIAGIAAAMNQDLDVLLIGELRSAEEAQAALTAAAFGHLVFTQLHVSTTPHAAIQRLIDAQPPEHAPLFRRDLALSLRAAVSQLLLPRAGGKNKVAAYGVLIPDDEMRQAISDGRSLFERTTPLPAGCQTIAQDVEKLQREGLVTDEAARAALETDRGRILTAG